MSEERQELRNIVEAALFIAESPLNIKRIQALFPDDAQPDADEILTVLHDLIQETAARGIELREIDGGWRFQTRDRYSPWLNRMFEKRPPRYSRALLETLAIIVYRQPVTRGDIEEIRGVAVSSDIMRTLQEREWIRAVGHRDVPGRPSLYATTQGFLEYFNLSSLSELPQLAQQRDIDEIAREMNLTLPFPSMDSNDETAGAEGESTPEQADDITDDTEDTGDAENDGAAVSTPHSDNETDEATSAQVAREDSSRDDDPVDAVDDADTSDGGVDSDADAATDLDHLPDSGEQAGDDADEFQAHDTDSESLREQPTLRVVGGSAHEADDRSDDNGDIGDTEEIEDADEAANESLMDLSASTDKDVSSDADEGEPEPIAAGVTPDDEQHTLEPGSMIAPVSGDEDNAEDETVESRRTHDDIGPAEGHDIDGHGTGSEDETADGEDEDAAVGGGRRNADPGASGGT